ncbi:hypothetical protein, partial [Cytobacillus kochii]|uniref:hypothetical protein n=1 Tax=Cytobacillus kochii TaxID=859143 RepID=UPI002040818A
MNRTVNSTMDFDVSEPATLAMEIAIAQDYLFSEREGVVATEELSVTAGGSPLPHRELTTAHGTRLHVVQAPIGPVHVEYSATIVGRLAPAPIDEVDLLHYLRPSRYCESDSLGPTAH